MLLTSSNTKPTKRCLYSCLQIPPKENWFQSVRRVYATAVNFPCIITLPLGYQIVKLPKCWLPNWLPNCRVTKLLVTKMSGYEIVSYQIIIFNHLRIQRPNNKFNKLGFQQCQLIQVFQCYQNILNSCFHCKPIVKSYITILKSQSNSANT